MVFSSTLILLSVINSIQGVSLAKSHVYMLRRAKEVLLLDKNEKNYARLFFDVSILKERTAILKKYKLSLFRSHPETNKF